MSDNEQLLRIIANNLKGELKHYTCVDKHRSYKKFVIEYAHENKDWCYNESDGQYPSDCCLFCRTTCEYIHGCHYAHLCWSYIGAIFCEDKIMGCCAYVGILVMYFGI